MAVHVSGRGTMTVWRLNDDNKKPAIVKTERDATIDIYDHVVIARLYDDTLETYALANCSIHWHEPPKVELK